MDNDKIPYIAFEAEMARHERTNPIVEEAARTVTADTQGAVITMMTVTVTAEDVTEWAGLPQEMRLKCHADSVR